MAMFGLGFACCSEVGCYARYSPFRSCLELRMAKSPRSFYVEEKTGQRLVGWWTKVYGGGEGVVCGRRLNSCLCECFQGS